MIKQILGYAHDGQSRAAGNASTAGGINTTPAPAPAPTPAATPFVGKSQFRHVLGGDVEIHGRLIFNQDLVFDGKIEGDIESEGCFTLGENGIVRGEIRAGSAVIFGRVEGNVIVKERCELKNSSAVVGDVCTLTLAIEEGATFLGRSMVGRQSLIAGLPPVQQVSAAALARESAPAPVIAPAFVSEPAPAPVVEAPAPVELAPAAEAATVIESVPAMPEVLAAEMPATESPAAVSTPSHGEHPPFAFAQMFATAPQRQATISY